MASANVRRRGWAAPSGLRELRCDRLKPVLRGGDRGGPSSISSGHEAILEGQTLLALVRFPVMRRATRLLLLLTFAAVAVPLVPFLLFGTRLDTLVAGWLEPRPAPLVLAALEIGVLAADLVLPVPSSLVATLGGAELGVVFGTACAFLGLSAGSFAGWWAGRAAGVRALAGLEAADRRELERNQRRLGPLLVVLTRPLPLVAEAAALLAGGSGMPLRDFLPAAASGNLAIALVWSAAGAVGRSADSLPMALIWSLVLPVGLAWLAVRFRRLPAE